MMIQPHMEVLKEKECKFMRDFIMAALPLVVAGIAWLCSSPDWQKRKRSRKRKTAMRPWG